MVINFCLQDILHKGINITPASLISARVDRSLHKNYFLQHLCLRVKENHAYIVVNVFQTRADMEPVV